MRILRLFRRRDLGLQIDKELQFHIEEQAARYIEAGSPPEEALRRARADFGGVQQIKEQMQGVWTSRWFDDLVQDVRFALRTYTRTRTFAGATVLTLALGIGVNTALFSITRQVLLNTLPVSKPQELVEIDCNSSSGTTGGGASCMQSYPAFRLLLERHEGLAGIFAFSAVPNGLVASFRGKREVITGQLASGNMFDILGVAPTAGRLLVATDDEPGAEPVAVLGYGYWLRTFGGDVTLVGQPLTLDGHAVTIIGVLPPAFRGVTFGEVYDVVLPLGMADTFRSGPSSPSGGRASILNSPNMGWLTFMGRRLNDLPEYEIATRLEPVFRQAAVAMMAPLPLDVRKQLNLNADGVRVDVRPAAFGATSNLRRRLEPTLRVVTIVAVLVLLIACTNVSGLFLGQALNRQREFGLRLALGAARSRLMRQVFTETLLLAAMGGAIGFLLAQWIAPGGFSLATDDTGLRAIDLGPDRWMLAFTGSLSMLAGLAAGAGIVLRVAATDPQEALRSLARTGFPRMTKGVLMAQIAFTVTLVGCAALLVQTLTNLRRIDIGFEPKGLMTVTMDAGLGSFEPPRAAEYLTRASDALAAVPGVRAVTYSNRALGSGVPMFLNLDIPGFTGSPDRASSGLIYVGPDFARTLGLRLLAGRDIAPTDRAGSVPVAIVNDSFATRFFGTVDALGRSFALRGPGNHPIMVAGVVKDARDQGVRRPSQPMMYLPFGHNDARRVTFTVRADASLSSVVPAVRRTLEGLDSAVGIARMETVDAQFDDALRRERLLAGFGAVFGGLALLLLAVGLYGLLTAMVVRRTTEIGIRMALGAARRQIAWMVARETLVILSLGAVFGLAGHATAGRLIRSQLFAIEPSNPSAAVATLSGLILIATVAVWLPAHRATRIQPGEALRHDYM